MEVFVKDGDDFTPLSDEFTVLSKSDLASGYVTKKEQADAIEGYLAGENEAGRLVYGTHRADSALMTCLVFSLEQSQHIHFIDGADGGFALAAPGFKKQLAALARGRQEGNG